MDMPSKWLISKLFFQSDTRARFLFFSIIVYLLRASTADREFVFKFAQTDVSIIARHLIITDSVNQSCQLCVYIVIIL